MAAQLFTYGRIITTCAKAKFFLPYGERLITIAKKGGLANYRRAIVGVGDRVVAKRLFDQISPHFSQRAGGCLRMLHYARSPRRESSREFYVTINRLGDNAPMALVELVGFSEGVFGDLFKKAKEKPEEKPAEGQ
jgi:large subunit ribosomal protein L17